MYWMQTLFIIDDAIQKVKENHIRELLSSLYANLCSILLFLWRVAFATFANVAAR